MSDILGVAILVAAVAGSVGYVGNSFAERRGGEALRWLRNGGVIVVWPLIVLWAFA